MLQPLQQLFLAALRELLEFRISLKRLALLVRGQGLVAAEPVSDVSLCGLFLLSFLLCLSLLTIFDPLLASLPRIEPLSEEWSGSHQESRCDDSYDVCSP